MIIIIILLLLLLLLLLSSLVVCALGIMRCVHACMHVWAFDYFCGTSFLHSFCIIIYFFLNERMYDSTCMYGVNL